MAEEKKIAFIIEVRGTDEMIAKQVALKKSIFETEDRLKTLKEITKDNVKAQQEWAATINNLETNLKSEKAQLNSVTKGILDNSKALSSAAGSQNELSARLALLTARWNSMSEAHRLNSVTGKLVGAQLLETRNRLIAFDETTNLHVRKVGNYTGGILQATQGLRGFAQVGNIAARAMRINTEGLQEGIQAVGGMVAGLKGLRAMQTASAAATDTGTGAIVKQTIAQRILNTVKTAAVPIIGWVIAGLTLLTAGIALYISKSEAATKAEEERSKALDGTIIKNKELRDSYNKNLLSISETENAYKVLNGTMSEFEATLDNLSNKYSLIISEIRNETKAKLEETKGFWGEFRTLFSVDAIFSLESDATLLEEARAKISKEGAEKEKAQIIEQGIEVRDATISNAQKTREWEINFLKEGNAIIAKNNEDKKKEDKKASDERLKQIEENNKKLKSAMLAIANQALKESEEAEKSMIETDKKIAGINEESQEKKAIRWDFWNKNKKKIDDDIKADEIKSAVQQEKELEDIEKQKQKNKELLVKAGFDALKRISDAAFDAKFRNLERQHKAELDVIGARNDLEGKKIDDMVERGIITQAQADIRRTALAKKFADEKLAADKKAFEKEKQLKIVQIQVAAALAILQIWAVAMPLSIPTFGASLVTAGVQTAIIAGMAAVESGIILAQKFSKGGIVKGSGTDTSDNITVSASRDEAIINANSSRMYRPLLSAINEAGGGRAFAHGGIPLPSPNSSLLSSAALNGLIDMDALANKLGAVINDKKVFIVEKEMSGAQTKARIYDNQNRF